MLADVCSESARKSQNGSGWPDRTWAEVATAIYDRLADDADRKKLRQLKNRLKVIAALADSDQYVLDENLNSWLSLREKLL